MRSSTDALDALLRQLLADLVVDEETDPNFSVHITAPESEDGPQPLHQLYRGHGKVVQRRTPRRIVETLLDQLGTYAAGGGSDHLEVQGVAVVRGDQAVLVPPGLGAIVARSERALQRSEISLLRLPAMLVDVSSLRLVIPPRPADDEALLAAVDGLAPLPPRPDPAIAEREFEVVGWAFSSDEPLSRGAAVFRACQQTTNVRRVGARRTLTALETIMRSATPIHVPHQDADALGNKLMSRWPS